MNTYFYLAVFLNYIIIAVSKQVGTDYADYAIIEIDSLCWPLVRIVFS